MEEAFALGARGECVRDLQQAMRVAADGRFGPRTHQAVRDMEKQLGREPLGLADADVFAAVGLPWPDEFRRTLALVVELEGTSYGDCNTTDIDGAGLTMGICGFTTRHGEVQALIEAFLDLAPDGWTCLPPSMQVALRRLIDASAPREPWEALLLDEKRRPRPATRAALASWGCHPVMQQLQREWAHERFWKPAVTAARELDIDAPAGRALLFDAWVQNGGWQPRHQRRLATLQGEAGQPASLGERLRLVAIAVAGEALAPWRADVQARKMLFARGAGMVHGTFYSLVAQAILPH